MLRVAADWAAGVMAGSVSSGCASVRAGACVSGACLRFRKMKGQSAAASDHDPRARGGGAGGLAEDLEQLAPDAVAVGGEVGLRERRGRRRLRSAPRACPSTASTRIRSPSCSLPIRPPSSASGATWMAEGTLPDAPDMRPSVTSATLWPRSCSTARIGVSACSSGMPLALGPWKRTTTIDVAVQLVVLERCLYVGLILEDGGGRLDHVALGRDGGDLHHAAAKIAASAPPARRSAGTDRRRGAGSCR